MRKLVLVALVIGGLSQATGCIISSDDDDDDDFQSGYIDFTWNLTEGVDETPAACPPGATTVRSISIPSTGQEIPDAYDCADGGHVSAGLPPDTYTVYLNVENDNGSVLYAQSYSETGVEVTEGGTTPLTFDVAVDGGYIGLTWTIEGGEATTAACDGVGATDVGVLATLVGTADATDDLFDCDAGEGTTKKILTGEYTVEVSLADAGGALCDVCAERDVTIEYGNYFEDLGNFDFTTN